MLDRRTYRDAAGTEAHLVAEIVTNHAGRWWSVSLVRADGSVAPVARAAGRRLAVTAFGHERRPLRSSVRAAGAAVRRS